MTLRLASPLAGASILIPLFASLAQGQTLTADPVTRFDAVTVSATRTETITIDSPDSVAVITREEIDRRMPNSVPEMLTDIPSVSFTGGARSIAQTPTIRGLGDDRVVVRLDGARQNFSGGHKGRIFVEPELLKQVDVVRGPGSTMFGSGALGGVMNMTTIDADDLLKPGQMMGGRAFVGYGSASTEKRGSLTAYARPLDSLDFLVSASVRDSGNMKHGNGDKLAYSAEDSQSGMIKIGINPAEHHRVVVSALRFDSEQQLPANGTTATSSNSNPLVDRTTIQDTYTLAYRYQNPNDALFDFSGTVYRNESDITEDRVGSTRHDTRSLTTDGLELTNTSRFSFTESVDNRLTYGVEAFTEDQQGRRNGEPTSGLFPDASMTTTGVFIQDEITLFDDWTLTPGVRYDSFDLSAQGQSDRSGSSTSPKVSLAWQATPWFQPYVSYAEAFRAPGLSDLYNTGLHFAMGPGMNNFFVPSPNLRPEKAKNTEIGANLKFRGVATENDALRIKVAAFENNITDYIEQRVATFTTSSVNVAEARIRGMEAEAFYDAGIVFASLGASRLRGDNLTDDQPLESIPADKVSITVGGRVSDWNLEGGWRTNMVAAQHRSSEDTQTGGYTIHDAFVSWTPQQFNDAVSLNVAVDNVFDRLYRPHGSGVYMAGRDVRLGASIQF
jgi:hemoglobin/transferrin/lactoferrin receptor protein